MIHVYLSRDRSGIDFQEFERKPSNKGMWTTLWHAIRLHKIDFDLITLQGGRFRCLNWGEKWWW